MSEPQTVIPSKTTWGDQVVKYWPIITCVVVAIFGVARMDWNQQQAGKYLDENGGSAFRTYVLRSDEHYRELTSAIAESRSETRVLAAKMDAQFAEVFRRQERLEKK